MVATCSTTDGNGSYHGLPPQFFEEMTRCRRQKQSEVVFPCQHWQRVLFSHSKNNFLTTLTPPKNRDIHIVDVFLFIDSIYSKTIDIFIRKILKNSIFRQTCVKPAIRIKAPFCRQRSSWAPGYRRHFAGRVLAGPSVNGNILQIIYSRIPGQQQSKG